MTCTSAKPTKSNLLCKVLGNALTDGGKPSAHDNNCCLMNIWMFIKVLFWLVCATEWVITVRNVVIDNTGLLWPRRLISLPFQAVWRQFSLRQLWLFITFYAYKSHIHKHSCNFRATIVAEIWRAAVWDLCVSSAGKWPLCRGAHLWWHYTRKQVYSGSCLQNRTLSSSSPLTDESPHISVVYSMAGSESHKCGQVLLRKLDLW